MTEAEPGGQTGQKGYQKMKLIIEANREGYAIEQIRRTMTVGEQISVLEQYDEGTPVYLGHDRQSYGFYTYGGITEGCFNEDEEAWHVVKDGEVVFTGTEEECDNMIEYDETGLLEKYPESGRC